MFGLTIGKLVALVVVLLAVWRGFKMIQRMTAAPPVARKPGGQPAGAPRGAADETAMDLVPCPHCGTYIAKGRPCPGPQRCIHRPAA